MKLITFIGSERCDFIYYLGRILSKMSTRVIVIDNSESHELFRAVLNPINEEDEDQEMVERSGITYLKDVAFSPDFFTTFEYIVIQMGTNYDDNYIKYADEIIAMPDYRPDSLNDVPMLPERAEFILRDRVGKLSDRSAAALLGISVDQIIGSLDYNDMDYGHYISLLYNGRQKLKGLSDDMGQALAYVTAKITEQSEKNVYKALKKERRAKA